MVEFIWHSGLPYLIEGLTAMLVLNLYHSPTPPAQIWTLRIIEDFRIGWLRQVKPISQADKHKRCTFHIFAYWLCIEFTKTRTDYGNNLSLGNSYKSQKRNIQSRAKQEAGCYWCLTKIYCENLAKWYRIDERFIYIYDIYVSGHSWHWYAFDAAPRSSMCIRVKPESERTFLVAASRTGRKWVTVNAICSTSIEERVFFLSSIHLCIYIYIYIYLYNILCILYMIYIYYVLYIYIVLL